MKAIKKRISGESLGQPQEWQEEHLDIICARYGWPKSSVEAKKLRAYIDKLDPKQDKILKDITEYLKRFQEEMFKKGQKHTEIAENIKLPYADYEKEMLKAIQAGLTAHPLVEEWVDARKAFGDWETLRKPRMGLERGVKRPHKIKDLKKIWEIIRLHEEEGFSWSRTHKILLDKGLIPQKSRQAFLRWVDRHGKDLLENPP